MERNIIKFPIGLYEIQVCENLFQFEADAQAVVYATESLVLSGGEECAEWHIVQCECPEE